MAGCRIGYLDDEALSELRSIYEAMRAERGLTCGSEIAEDLAAAIVDLYVNGITDEGEIRQALERQRAA